MLPKNRKYFVLLVINLLIVYQFIQFGDYCVNALVEVLLSFVLLIIYALVFIVGLTNNYRQSRKGNVNFERAFLIMPVVLVISLLLGWKYGDRLNYEEPKYVIVHNYGKIYRWKVYVFENEEFELRDFQIGSTCVYKGSWEQNGDTLKLLREDIPDITEGEMNAVYLLDWKQKTAFPLDTNMLKCEIVDSKYSDF